jgi:type I restriction enzyme S subunit
MYNQTIPVGWTEATLGEVSQNISRAFNFSEHNDVIFVNTGDVLEGKFLHSNKSKPNSLPGQAKKAIKKGDILLSEIRPVNKRFAMVDFDADDYVVSTKFMVIAHNDSIEVDYLYKFLTSKNTLQTLQEIAESRSGTFPQITFDGISYLPLKLPPLPEQRAIVAVLSSLDDKIELLREQNKTLEATAQAIFKEWFGKYSPDRPEELPEGWRVGKMGEEFEISIGRTPPRGETQWFSHIPKGKKWISIKDIGNSGAYIFNTSEYLTFEAIEKFNIPVIPKNTTVLSFKMTVGKLAITTEDMLSNEAIAHLKIKSDSMLTSEFIYCSLQGMDFNVLGSTSSIVTAINSTMIRHIEIIIPDEILMGRFDRTIKPLFQKIFNNSCQIQILANLRDALLPKLMRGEVRVHFSD